MVYFLGVLEENYKTLAIAGSVEGGPQSNDAEIVWYSSYSLFYATVGIITLSGNFLQLRSNLIEACY